MITALSKELNVDDIMISYTMGLPEVTTSVDNKEVKVSSNVRLEDTRAKNKVKLTQKFETSKCRVYIPQIMSGIPHEKAKITVNMVNVSPSILNATLCKPVFKRKINSQNFMSVEGKRSETGWTKLPVGTQVYCSSDLNRINNIKCTKTLN